MAKRTERIPSGKGKDIPTNNEKKKNIVIVSITQVFRNLSISVNMTVYTIYLIYLAYSIYANIGIRIINIALALVTLSFMMVYLVLRLSNKKRGKQLRAIKHYYKNFKLIARTVSSITAVYALITAVSAVSPLAMIVSFLGAVFLVIRLIVELILGLIRRKIRKSKAGREEKARKVDESYEGDFLEDFSDEPAQKKPKKKKRLFRPKNKKDDDGDYEDVIIPVDLCLLNDIDE